MRWIALLLLIWPAATAAEEVIAGLSKNRISISANFDGSELLVFGAVKRDSPLAPGDHGIVITVEGPKTPLMVRRKDRTGLIWVNRDAVEIDAAPSFYSVNTSGPLRQVLGHVPDMRHAVTIDQAIRSVGAPDTIANPTLFTEALVRVRERANLYQLNENSVTFRQETLFDTSVALPANLVEGIYTARLFLTRDRAVVAQASSAINVEKVGLERFLYTLAHDAPVTYGLLSLVIAIAAGWGASAIFRYLQS